MGLQDATLDTALWYTELSMEYLPLSPRCVAGELFKDNSDFLKYGSTLVQLHPSRPFELQALYSPGTERVYTKAFTLEVPPSVFPEIMFVAPTPFAMTLRADVHWYVGERGLRKSTESSGTRENHESTTGPRSSNRTLTLLSSERREAKTHPPVPPMSHVSSASKLNKQRRMLTANYNVIKRLPLHIYLRVYGMFAI